MQIVEFFDRPRLLIENFRLCPSLRLACIDSEFPDSEFRKTYNWLNWLVVEFFCYHNCFGTCCSQIYRFYFSFDLLINLWIWMTIIYILNRILKQWIKAILVLHKWGLVVKIRKFLSVVIISLICYYNFHIFPVLDQHVLINLGY